MIGDLLGHGTELTVAQMSIRAALGFIITLILVRTAGRRSFAMHSPFDNVIALLLGAVLSRAVVGASPFLPTVAACAVIVLLHRACAWVATRSHGLGRLIKGESVTVFEDGQVLRSRLRGTLMSDKDLHEELRLHLNQETFEGVERIEVERSGRVAFVRAPREPSPESHDSRRR